MSSIAQKPMRRGDARTLARFFGCAPWICAIIGDTAASGPHPRIQQKKNAVLPSAAEASASVLRWPSMMRSVVMIAICASCVAASGRASFIRLAGFGEPCVQAVAFDAAAGVGKIEFYDIGHDTGFFFMARTRLWWDTPETKIPPEPGSGG